MTCEELTTLCEAFAAEWTWEEVRPTGKQPFQGDMPMMRVAELMDTVLTYSRGVLANGRDEGPSE